MSLTGGDYEAFPEKWQRVLFIPFTVGRVKQVDSSQFEYSDSFKEFIANLETFRVKFEVPDEYKDPKNKGSYAPDYTGNWWGWN